MGSWPLIVVAGLVVYRPLWRPARMVITYLHELGHVAATLLGAGRPRGLHLRGDTSGLTEWERTLTPGPLGSLGHRLATAFVAGAGYPAPGIAGLALTACAVSGDRAVRAAFAALAVGAVASLWLARGWRTVGVVVLFAAAAGCGAWRPLAEVLAGFALFACIGGLRSSLELWRLRPRRGDGSDPGQLATVLLLPARMWTVGFVAVNAATVAAAAGLLTGRIVLP